MQISELVQTKKSHWDNVYWFSRMFINNDKYVSIANDTKLLLKISSSLRLLLNQMHADVQLSLIKGAIRTIIEERFQKSETRKERVQKFLNDLEEEIKTKDDILVLIFTCETILIPLQQSISCIPNDDKEFTLTLAKSFLDNKGKLGLGTVITFWDELGVKGCLTVERREIVKAFALLRMVLEKDKDITNEDKDVILTAFVQEYERRVAQKRKTRAGGSLENVTNFILDYYKIPTAKSPEHFQTDIEVDNWIKTKDNWLIGISCKRTLRERWKQVSSAEAYTLGKYKIKHIYHIITYDEDLSDEKLTMLGSQRHIFYLPDTSRRLQYALQHIGLKEFVRPISNLISDIEVQLK